MKKLLFCSIIFSLTVFTAAAQKLNVVVNYVSTDVNANANNINYKPGQLLTWDDFKANPVEASEAAAITSAGFGLKLMFKRNENKAELVISVNCSFSKKDSWVKKKYKTDYILNHEQKHFDIAYLHTILFIQKLQQANYTTTNYAAVIEKIYKEAAADLSKFQNEYDSQTSHSRLTEKQQEWDAKIAKQLGLIAILEKG